MNGIESRSRNNEKPVIHKENPRKSNASAESESNYIQHLRPITPHSKSNRNTDSKEFSRPPVPKSSHDPLRALQTNDYLKSQSKDRRKESGSRDQKVARET